MSTPKLDLEAIRQDVANYAKLFPNSTDLDKPTLALCDEVERLRKALNEFATHSHDWHAAAKARQALED